MDPACRTPIWDPWAGADAAGFLQAQSQTGEAEPLGRGRTLSGGDVVTSTGGPLDLRAQKWEAHVQND